MALAEGYDDADGRYPVIYVLDGQWDFKLVMSLHGGCASICSFPTPSW